VLLLPYTPSSHLTCGQQLGVVHFQTPKRDPAHKGKEIYVPLQVVRLRSTAIGDRHCHCLDNFEWLLIDSTSHCRT